MGKIYDILIDETGESKIKDGDYEIGEVTEQNAELMVVCEKGENTMFPADGVGLGTWILDEADPSDLKKETADQLEGDDQDVESMTYDENGFTVKSKSKYGA